VVGCKRISGALAGAVLAIAVAASPAAAKPGDLIVTSYLGAPPPTVVRIDPATHHVSLISDDSALTYPQGLTFGPTGEIFVLDDASATIFRIAPDTGDATVTSDDPDIRGDYLDLGPDRRFYVPNPHAKTLFRFRLGNSDLVPFSTDHQLSGGPYGVEVDHNGSILVGNCTSDAKLVRVNPTTGAQHLVADASSKTDCIAGMAVAPDETIYASTASYKLLRINPRTGHVSILSGGGLFNFVYDVAIAPNGSLYVTNYDSDVNDPEVLKVNRKTGFQSVVARYAGHLHAAAGIEVQPPKCGGRIANIVGSNKADHLKGSKFADVIAGLKGDDVIKGLRGNDRLCGGRGDDTLIGGKGHDKLVPGPGSDTVRQ